MKNVVYIFIVFFSVACKQEVVNDLDGVKSYSVKIHSTMGVEREFKINIGTESFESLRFWLYANQKGWEKSPASYVPGIVVKYKDSQLNFINDLAVLNNQTGQYTKEASIKDYGFLLQ